MNAQEVFGKFRYKRIILISKLYKRILKLRNSIYNLSFGELKHTLLTPEALNLRSPCHLSMRIGFVELILVKLMICKRMVTRSCKFFWGKLGEEDHNLCWSIKAICCSDKYPEKRRKRFNIVEKSWKNYRKQKSQTIYKGPLARNCFDKLSFSF